MENYINPQHIIIEKLQKTKMSTQETLQQIKAFANNIALLAADFSIQINDLEEVAGDLSEKLITAKDILKQDLHKLQDNLSTIEQKIKDLYNRQDPKDGQPKQ